jgi:hypothetical protein
MNTISKLELASFAESLNSIRKRDWAMERAKELYYMGHRADAVKMLILEARMHNHRAIAFRKVLQ